MSYAGSARLTNSMDENKQAILLLSSYFSKPGNGAPTPLTALEYGRFAGWMAKNDFKPSDLFHRADELLRNWSDPKKKVTSERVLYLMGRGLAMSVALEKWQSAGIWVIARSDSEYPQQLKDRLHQASPAVLFGVGEKRLLNSGGLAVVGSRGINAAEVSLTSAVSARAAREGLNVVSGGAKGVDETAMVGALEADGTAVGVLANDLFKGAVAGKWRQYLKRGDLVLVSPFYPEARFQVGNAMGRNKYIYCLADYGLVVRSEQGSGGTWAGATENLKKNWVPLFSALPSGAEGNAALIDMGARPLELDLSGLSLSSFSLRSQLDDVGTGTDSNESQATTATSVQLVNEPNVNGSSSVDSAHSYHENAQVVIECHQGIQSYSEFLPVATQFISGKGNAKFADINDHFEGITKKCVREWLDAAVEAGELVRPGRALVYIVNAQGDALSQSV